MEKIQMLCYSGETWDSTPLGEKAICDIGGMTAEVVAAIADLQQEMGRKIHIKRITGGEKWT